MGVEGDGGAPLRRSEGGQRKQLGRARWRWRWGGEAAPAFCFKLPVEANTNKQCWTAKRGGEWERNGRRGEEAEKSQIQDGQKGQCVFTLVGPAVRKNRTVVQKDGLTT